MLLLSYCSSQQKTIPIVLTPRYQMYISEVALALCHVVIVNILVLWSFTANLVPEIVWL